MWLIYQQRTWISPFHSWFSSVMWLLWHWMWWSEVPNYNQRWQLWELCSAEEFLPRKNEWTFTAQKKSQLFISGAATAFLCAWNQVLRLCGLCHWWEKEHEFNSAVQISRCAALELCTAQTGNILENTHSFRNSRAMVNLKMHSAP